MTQILVNSLEMVEE